MHNFAVLFAFIQLLFQQILQRDYWGPGPIKNNSPFTKVTF